MPVPIRYSVSDRIKISAGLAKMSGWNHRQVAQQQ